MPNDDLTAQFPLQAESPASIRARMLMMMNAGIDPADPTYADTAPGSIWDDIAGAGALEADRLYDRMLTEVPAAALPSTAIGAWLDGWADVVGLERKAATTASGVVRFTGADGTPVPTGVQVSTEAPTPDAEPITFQTTEAGTVAGTTVDLAVEALESGSAGNVPANAVTILDTPLPGVSVTNATAITGGSDVETDEALSERVIKKFRGTQGAGNVDYYANLALNYPGVGYATVQPNVPSIGHVTVVISDVNRDPAPTAIVDGLQAQLDPSDSPGQGAGLAAPGATIHVTTPTGVVVSIAATLALLQGYSLDGSAGTQDVTPDVLSSLLRYFQSLAVGDEVVYNKVLAAIVDVDGVDDVTALTLTVAGTAYTANVTIDPASVAELDANLALSAA